MALPLLAEDAGRLVIYLWSLVNPENVQAKPDGMAWAEWFEFSFKQKGNNYYWHYQLHLSI